MNIYILIKKFLDYVQVEEKGFSVTITNVNLTNFWDSLSLLSLSIVLSNETLLSSFRILLLTSKTKSGNFCNFSWYLFDINLKPNSMENQVLSYILQILEEKCLMYRID